MIHQWDMATYQAHEALSAGMAHTMVTECPLMAWWESPFNPERTVKNGHHLDIGTAAHLAVLENHRFAEACSLIAADNYRSKAAQELREACWAAGRVPLLPQDYELVRRLKKALETSAAAPLLFEGGDSEVSFTWDFDGMACKARADRIAGHTIVDLKTAVSASPVAFANAIARDGHHLRAAWYIDGWNEDNAARITDYLYIIAGKSEPHLVEVYRVDQRALEYGRRLYRKALRQFRECRASGVWPGYSREEVTTVSLPVYAEHQLADLEAAGEL
jgi:hypothetical protein